LQFTAAIFERMLFTASPLLSVKKLNNKEITLRQTRQRGKSQQVFLFVFYSRNVLH